MKKDCFITETVFILVPGAGLEPNPVYCLILIIYKYYFKRVSILSLQQLSIRYYYTNKGIILS